MHRHSLARSRRLAGAASILLLVACKHDATTSAPTPVATTITVTSGDAQTIVAGAAASTPLSVKVVDASGAPMSGVTVTWTLASGSGTLSAATSTTDANGVATVTYTAGLTAGTATVTATAGALTPITFTESIVAPPSSAPIVAYAQTGGSVATTFQSYT